MKYLAVLGLCLLALSCSDILDKTDPNSIDESDVWNDETLALGFLNEIYDQSMPGWPISSSSFTDNAVGINSLMYGELGPNERQIYGPTYSRIRKINVLLESIEAGNLDPDFVRLVKAQARFFRAWNYFNLVSTYGGVPLILSAKSLSDDLAVPRNTTTECFEQIYRDLDEAIEALPSTYPTEDYGRITKGAAMALKGRMALYYASEQFDPNQRSSERWENALSINEAALEELDAQGKGLHSSFSGLWFDESPSNPEAVLVRKYAVDKNTNRDVGVRPFVTGTNGEAWDKPTLSLVKAFPMKDGVAIDQPTSQYTYDETVFWLNRDPRFMSTIAYNGANWPINEPEPIKTSPIYWSFQGNRIVDESDSRISPSSFSCRKAVDESLEAGVGLYQSTTDWIEIRYAEVLMNFAEAANEMGETAKALDVLMRLRERAGIVNTNGYYGLDANMSKEDMRDALLAERRIEFAFEGKREMDLRRRRLYHRLNGSHRQGYVIFTTMNFEQLNPSAEILDDRITLENNVLSGAVLLNNPSTYTTYFETSVRSVERDGNIENEGLPINFQDHYYFFDLPQSAMDKNSALTQTQGWPGGTFDPLQ